MLPGKFLKNQMYRIQTDARVITGNTTEIKNRGRIAVGRGFLFRGCISRNHEGEVCILFKWMLIKNRPRVYDVFLGASKLALLFADRSS